VRKEKWRFAMDLIPVWGPWWSFLRLLLNLVKKKRKNLLYFVISLVEEPPSLLHIHWV
jgi:hypothetical protein